MQSEQTKLPPFSEAAERGVLGGLLRWPAAMDAVAGMLEPASFYFHSHTLIFQAMLDLHSKRKPIDLTTVYELVKVAEVRAGYLADLWDFTPTGANTEHHASIVKDKAIQRALIHLSAEIARDAQDGIAPGIDLLSDAEAKLAALRLQGARGELPATIGQAVDEAVKRIDDRAAKPNAGAITTGFDMLDKMLTGLYPGELVCVAARQSTGKSALAQAIAIHAAKGGKKVLFASMEMSRVDIAQRALVNESSVPNWKVRSSKIDASDVDAIGLAANRLHSVGVRFDDEPGLTVTRFISKCRILKRKEGLDLAVADYIQLFRPENTRIPRNEQVAATSRALKQMAMELELPVIILSQLNRGSEQENRQPRLSDLSASDAIASDCDSVILLHRPTEDREHGKPEPIDVIVVKQRNGETGIVKLNYIGHLFRFQSDIPKL